MRIEFLQPSDELIAVLASLEEYLFGEIVITDAIHVEAVSPRAQNIVAMLRDPIYQRARQQVSFSPITPTEDLIQTDRVQP